MTLNIINIDNNIIVFMIQPSNGRRLSGAREEGGRHYRRATKEEKGGWMTMLIP